MREFYAEVRSCRLCLCEWGAEGKPLVLCLHGIRDQGAVWEPVATPLAAAGFRVLAPDLRGHGRSCHVPRGTLTNLMDLLADLDHLAAALADGPFVLVGHSMGSMLAAMFAAARADKLIHLLLVEPVLPPQGQDDDVVAHLTAQLDYLASGAAHPAMPDVATAALLLRSYTPSLPEPLSLQLAGRGTQHGEGGLRWRWDPLLRDLYGIAFNGTREQYLSLLQRITVPITLVMGTSSSFHSSEEGLIRTALPRARSLILRGGHNIHLDAAAALSRCIAEAAGARTTGSALAGIA